MTNKINQNCSTKAKQTALARPFKSSKAKPVIERLKTITKNAMPDDVTPAQKDLINGILDTFVLSFRFGALPATTSFHEEHNVDCFERCVEAGMGLVQQLMKLESKASSSDGGRPGHMLSPPLLNGTPRPFEKDDLDTPGTP